jgi:hypothetical protein
VEIWKQLGYAGVCETLRKYFVARTTSSRMDRMRMDRMRMDRMRMDRMRMDRMRMDRMRMDRMRMGKECRELVRSRLKPR